jgi:3-amino-4-hydroxybenzoic acid synthase
MNQQKDSGTRLHAWYDSAALRRPGAEQLLTRALDGGYTAVVLHPEDAQRHAVTLPDHVLRILHVTDLDEWHEARAKELVPSGDEKTLWVVSSEDLSVLDDAAATGVATCFRVSAHDQESLLTAIGRGRSHRYVLVRFPDPTNIPLELVIASLQSTTTIVIKEITDPGDSEDAIVALGVMEVGSEGVLFSPTEADVLDTFLGGLRGAGEPRVPISTATILNTSPIGMGHRGCIDLATIFSPTEGMIVGSTSQGGLLCCPEVFFLPYMELRPFRVNAGAVHSYVYATGDRTNYLTELRAGVPAMVVGTDGRVREVPVGRIKIEIRPLRLIEAQFDTGEKVNVVLQDDWHVRIFSAEGQPLNITELAPGDRVLGHVATPGRHVGIPVDETIEEV